MDPVVYEILNLLGFLLRSFAFLILGFAISRFVLDSYKAGEWQVRAALALGYFGLLVGITAYSSPASSGAFALGAATAFVYVMVAHKGEERSTSVG